MTLNQNDILIIPDVHGRTFWKEAVKENEERTIVFLGDYLDPYPDEGITNKMAWDNFIEIIIFKKEHPNNVHLLLGNHDYCYLNPKSYCSRRDMINLNRNHNIFANNLELFEMAYETEIKGQRYIFSHAGVNRQWLLEFASLFDGDNITAEVFNQALYNPDARELFYRALSCASHYRGGQFASGSMVWADIREFTEDDTNLPDIIQIVGHTFVEKELCLEGRIYLLDCARAFVLDQEGEVFRYE